MWKYEKMKVWKWKRKYELKRESVKVWSSKVLKWEDVKLWRFKYVKLWGYESDNMSESERGNMWVWKCEIVKV